jgi:hypothetical protein
MFKTGVRGTFYGVYCAAVYTIVRLTAHMKAIVFKLKVNNLLCSICCTMIIGGYVQCEAMEDRAAEMTSGVLYHNSNLGFFPIRYGEEGMQYGPKLSFEELVSRLNWHTEIPTNQDLFASYIRLSADERKQAFFRFSAELIFCCIEHFDMSNKIENLSRFVNLLHNCDDEDLKIECSKSLRIAITDDMTQLCYAAVENNISLDVLDIPLAVRSISLIIESLDGLEPISLDHLMP